MTKNSLIGILDFYSFHPFIFLSINPSNCVTLRFFFCHFLLFESTKASPSLCRRAHVHLYPRTMWLPRLALLLLLLRLSGVLLVEGINTCQSINLDRQKSRRIEAVRGQILSKLRIRSPPDEDDEPPAGNVPAEVMLLYNSTRKLLKERARQAESACERESSEEDYYAKEVQRIDMMPPRTDSSEFR